MGPGFNLPNPPTQLPFCSVFVYAYKRVCRQGERVVSSCFVQESLILWDLTKYEKNIKRVQNYFMEHALNWALVYVIRCAAL